MKNRYGFTLIEMMAIISLLAVLTLVTAPTIIRLYKSDSKKEYDEYIETLELATESYIKSNIDKYPQLKTAGGSVNITIKTLRDEGYVKKNLINPKTKNNTLDTDGFKVTANSDMSLKYEWITS